MPSDDMSYYALNRPLATVNEKLWVPGAPVVGSAGESGVLISVPYVLFVLAPSSAAERCALCIKSFLFAINLKSTNITLNFPTPCPICFFQHIRYIFLTACTSSGPQTGKPARRPLWRLVPLARKLSLLPP